jgi:threonine/homoserine/homoserine lactone efflux protein
MNAADWLAFAGFWVVFVTAPGPNAVNCVANGMTYGFRRALWGVAGILTQAALFLTLAAAGVAAALAAAPSVEGWLRLAGAGVLVWLGLRTVLRARRPVVAGSGGGSIYGRAFLIATVNAKSLAGYLAAFTQVLRTDAGIWGQMAWIYPTALTITAASYCGYTALGALAGRSAMGAVMNLWFRRVMGLAFVAYGVALALSGPLPVWGSAIDGTQQ